MVGEAERMMGGVDVLVHLAGAAMLKDVLEVDPAAWTRVIDINGRHIPLLPDGGEVDRRPRWQRMSINIGSAAAHRPSRGASAYGAAKAGVINLTRALATDLAHRNIRVNAISPGPVDTDMAKNEHRSETRKNFERLIPMARYARAEEMASAAVFLASDESSYVSGAEITVDGGYSGAGNLA